MDEEQVVKATDTKNDSPEKSDSVNSVLLSIIVILLLVITAGAAYLFGTSKKPEESPSPTPTQEAIIQIEETEEEPQESPNGSPTATPTATPTPTPTGTPIIFNKELRPEDIRIMP